MPGFSIRMELQNYCPKLKGSLTPALDVFPEAPASDKATTPGNLGGVFSFPMCLLYWARKGRPGLVQQMVSIGRRMCNWSQLPDDRLTALLSYVKSTCAVSQLTFVAKGSADRVVVDLFCDADLAGDASSARHVLPLGLRFWCLGCFTRFV